MVGVAHPPLMHRRMAADVLIAASLDRVSVNKVSAISKCTFMFLRVEKTEVIILDRRKMLFNGCSFITEG